MAPDPPPTRKSPDAAQAESANRKRVAADAVFNTAELLEKILIDVPLKNLFTSQRGSKQWKAAISDFKKLQQIMFLRAADAEVAFRKFEHIRDEYASSKDVYGSNLRTYSLEVLPLKSVDRSRRHSLQASLNPLITLESVLDEIKPHYRAEWGDVVIVQDEGLHARILHLQAASTPLLQGYASCLDMFICQPPPKAVKVSCADSIVTIDCPDGVRVRDIVNGLDPMVSVVARPGPRSGKLRDTRLGIKFAGTICDAEFGDALLFCSSAADGVEDPGTKKGVTYDYGE